MNFTCKKFYIGCLTLLFFFSHASGQSFSNLNFQDTCISSKTGLCHWDLSWGDKESVRQQIVDSSMCLSITGKAESAVGFAEQAALYDVAKGMTIISISAFIKSENIIGKGAGLNIGLYDNEGTLVSTKDMGGVYSLNWIRETSPWKKYSISIVAPLKTAKVKIGAILYGKGKAYFKNYKVNIVSIDGRKPSKLAIDYIEGACDTIKINSLVRDSIDIEQLKRNALKIAGNAKQYSDCYLAISYLLESLRPFGDEHSFFMSAAEVKNWENEGSQIDKIEYPIFKMIDSCGYIFVPSFHGGNRKQILSFADSLQNGIQALYDSGIKGWIVDLRQNTGGNMAPMVAGLGPLFSNEKLGSLINVSGKPNSWYYKNGKYFWDADTGWSVSKPVTLSNRFPIAVLVSERTGSSGEAVAVSFIGNEKTKLFGQPTWGLTTGNGNFELQDGSQIFLASTVYADRDGKKYGGKIRPDFIQDTSEKGENDLVVATALRWLLSKN